MSTLTEFFHGDDTKLGVFYPNHHLFAIFSDPATAARTAGELRSVGFPYADVISTDGRAVLKLEKEERGPGAAVMQAMSRFFSTEQLFADHDLEEARHGRGFLAVRCPTDEMKLKAWGVIQRESPLDARYYSSAGIEHLAGDVKTKTE
jgi:hypothetical protein